MFRRAELSVRVEIVVSTGLPKLTHFTFLSSESPAYFVSFGPHGPRKPITQPGQGLRTLIATGGLVGLTFAIFYTMRTFAAPAPKTMTKEYQEQMTEKAREENLNPISGISSENYKGKGYVQGN